MEEQDYRQQLQAVKNLGIELAQEIDINLAIATENQELNISGNFFYIKEAPTSNDYVIIKPNSSSARPITWVKQMGRITPFNRLYITTPAGQTGIMKIIIAAEAPHIFDIIDHRSAISSDMAAILDQLRGDTTAELYDEVTCGVAQVQILAANANRKGAEISSDINNTGYIYLGFDNTVTLPGVGAKKWFKCLTPGESWSIDNYRGAIHGICTIANQPVGFGEW